MAARVCAPLQGDTLMSIHPRMAAFIEDVQMGSPVARAFGIAVETARVDRVVLKMPFALSRISVGRNVHGGAIATLIDLAGSAACATGADVGAIGGVTGSLTISYLNAADGVDLFAEGIVLKRSRSQTVTDVTVRDGSGRAIAKGLVTSKIFLQKAGAD